MLFFDNVLLAHHTTFEFHGGALGHALHIPPYQILKASAHLHPQSPLVRLK